MVLILALDQFQAITEKTLSVVMIHGNFRISLLAILKQKCQCLLRKKLNFLGYNYASINKKGHAPTTHTVVKYFITTPSCHTLYRGAEGVFEQIRKKSYRMKMISCARKHKTTLHTYHVLANTRLSPPALTARVREM